MEVNVRRFLMEMDFWELIISLVILSALPIIMYYTGRQEGRKEMQMEYRRREEIREANQQKFQLYH